MKNKEKILLAVLLAVLLVALLAGAMTLYRALGDTVRGEGPTAVAPGQESSVSPSLESSAAPEKVYVPQELSFTDPDGNIITLGDLQGKPLVLNFWATWCTYCRQEMPDFLEIYDRYGESVQFVILNVGETRETAEAFLQENGWERLPVYYDDQDLQMAQAFGASGLPMTFFIDSEGALVAYEPGMTTAQRLELGIGMMTEEAGEPAAQHSQTSVSSEASAVEEAVNPSWCTMDPVYTKITPENALSLMQEDPEYLLLDLRDEAAYQEEHIPGAVRVSAEELEAQIAVLRPDLRALILVYSDSETHSEEAARSLVALGYNHVYDFGAIEQWPYDTASGS